MSSDAQASRRPAEPAPLWSIYWASWTLLGPWAAARPAFKVSLGPPPPVPDVPAPISEQLEASDDPLMQLIGTQFRVSQARQAALQN